MQLIFLFYSIFNVSFFSIECKCRDLSPGHAKSNKIPHKFECHVRLTQKSCVVSCVFIDQITCTQFNYMRLLCKLTHRFGRFYRVVCYSGCSCHGCCSYYHYYFSLLLYCTFAKSIFFYERSANVYHCRVCMPHVS